MKKSKLVTLLSSFSKEEMRNFEKFIESPYFNKERNFKPLFTILKKNYPAFDNSLFTEERIFKKLYPGKIYDSKTSVSLRVIESQLTNLAEKFLVYNRFETGEFDYVYNKCLAKIYIEKNNFDSALKVVFQNSKIIDEDINKNNHYNKRLEIYSLFSTIFIRQMKPKENHEHTSKNILYLYSSFIDRFTEFYAKYRTNLRNYNLIYKGDKLVMHFIKTFDLELFNKECDEDDFETKNLTLINYYFLKSHIDELDRESLQNAINIYLLIFDKLTRYKQFHLFVLLFSRCTERINFDSFYIKVGNDLIDHVWGQGIVSYESRQYTPPQTYLVALHFKMALPIGIRKFVSENSGNIAPEYKFNILNYSKACIHFKEREFGKCLESLLTVDLSKWYRTNIYKLKICSYFELSLIENTLSEIDSFEHYLRKNKNVSELMKTGNFNFISGMKKLIKVRLGKIKEPDFDMKEIRDLTQNSLWGYWFKEKSLLEKTAP